MEVNREGPSGMARMCDDMLLEICICCGTVGDLGCDGHRLSRPSLRCTRDIGRS